MYDIRMVMYQRQDDFVTMSLFHLLMLLGVLLYGVYILDSAKEGISNNGTCNKAGLGASRTASE